MAVTAVTAVIGALLALVASAVAMTRLRASTGQARDRLLWLVWGATVTFAAGVAGSAFAVLVDWPRKFYAGAAVGCAVVLLAVMLGRWARPTPPPNGCWSTPSSPRVLCRSSKPSTCWW